MINQSIHLIEDRGLEQFTTEEAESCILTRADKVLYNSVFQYWIIQVQDKLNNLYEWKDLTLAESPTTSAISYAAILHLVDNVNKIPYGPETITDVVYTNGLRYTYEDASLGETVGASGQGVGIMMRENIAL